ncbi:MAG: hypothetical protein KGJ66_00065 [Alphaproteobacteria bacterium]|nr:hypothetical protein [Alphaproteobacteria bacterium]
MKFSGFDLFLRRELSKLAIKPIERRFLSLRAGGCPHRVVAQHLDLAGKILRLLDEFLLPLTALFKLPLDLVQLLLRRVLRSGGAGRDDCHCEQDGCQCRAARL